MVSKEYGYLFLLIFTALLLIRVSFPIRKYGSQRNREAMKNLKTDTHFRKDHQERFSKSYSDREKFDLEHSNSVDIYKEKNENILIKINLGASNESSFEVIGGRNLKLNSRLEKPKKNLRESNSLGIIKSDSEGLQKAFLKMQFYSYLVKFNKNYTGKEYRKRFRNFRKSLREISRLNKAGNGNKNGALYGLTKFSDMSRKEFAKTLLLKEANNIDNSCDTHRYCSSSGSSSIKKTHSESSKYPKKFDWRKKGVVGPIVYQGSCGGCWAISIVGVMESMAAIAKLKSPRLSIQIVRPRIHMPIACKMACQVPRCLFSGMQVTEEATGRRLQTLGQIPLWRLLAYVFWTNEVLDCIPYNRGCSGGSVYKALDYMCDHKLTVVSESAYPLKFVNEVCRAHSDKGFRLNTFIRRCAIPETTDLLNIIANHGPVVALVNAFTWSFYLQGVIQANCDASYVNHAVQIVGYDLTAPTPYYTVRNSWGDDFGDGGYVYVAIGKNMCGIASDVFYLDVKKYS